MENLYAIFEFYWQQKLQQADAPCMENTQLHKGKQLEQMCTMMYMMKI